MSSHEIENWRKVKRALEASGKTDSQIYARACKELQRCGEIAEVAQKKFPRI